MLLFTDRRYLVTGWWGKIQMFTCQAFPLYKAHAVILFFLFFVFDVYILDISSFSYTNVSCQKVFDYDG